MRSPQDRASARSAVRKARAASRGELEVEVRTRTPRRDRLLTRTSTTWRADCATTRRIEQHHCSSASRTRAAGANEVLEQLSIDGHTKLHNTAISRFVDARNQTCGRAAGIRSRSCSPTSTTSGLNDRLRARRGRRGADAHRTGSQRVRARVRHPRALRRRRVRGARHRHRPGWRALPRREGSPPPWPRRSSCCMAATNRSTSRSRSASRSSRAIASVSSTPPTRPVPRQGSRQELRDGGRAARPARLAPRSSSSQDLRYDVAHSPVRGLDSVRPARAVEARFEVTRVIGLTGGIGTGKSTVARMLAELGAVVIDADAIVHELQAPGSPRWPRSPRPSVPTSSMRPAPSTAPASPSACSATRAASAPQRDHAPARRREMARRTDAARRGGRRSSSSTSPCSSKPARATAMPRAAAATPPCWSTHRRRCRSTAPSRATAVRAKKPSAVSPRSCRSTRNARSRTT